MIDDIKIKFLDVEQITSEQTIPTRTSEMKCPLCEAGFPVTPKLTEERRKLRKMIQLYGMGSTRLKDISFVGMMNMKEEDFDEIYKTYVTEFNTDNTD